MLSVVKASCSDLSLHAIMKDLKTTAVTPHFSNIHQKSRPRHRIIDLLEVHKQHEQGNVVLSTVLWNPHCDTSSTLHNICYGMQSLLQIPHKYLPHSGVLEPVLWPLDQYFCPKLLFDLLINKRHVILDLSQK